MSKDQKSSNGVTLGYEQKLWQAADTLRSTNFQFDVLIQKAFIGELAT